MDRVNGVPQSSLLAPLLFDKSPIKLPPFPSSHVRLRAMHYSKRRKDDFQKNLLHWRSKHCSVSFHSFTNIKILRSSPSTVADFQGRGAKGARAPIRF